MDENMPPSVSVELEASGIDVSSVHKLEIFGENDPNLLELATSENRVMCTRDADYIRMARTGVAHTGIVFFEKGQRDIGYIVTNLRKLAEELSALEMKNRVEYR